jgi:outer membrane protein OmpA-like peptidoglycan-associated protein
MNKRVFSILTIALMFLSMSQLAYTQTDKKEKKEKEKEAVDPASKSRSWQIGFNIGTVQPYTDVRSRTLIPATSWGVNGGVSVAKWFNSALGLRAQFDAGRMNGRIAGKPAGYTPSGATEDFPGAMKGKSIRNKTIYFGGSINLVLNLSGLGLMEYGPRITKKKERNHSIYLLAGVGMYHYTARNYDLKTGAEFTKYQEGYSGNANDVYFPLGIGVSRKLTKSLQLDIEAGARLFTTDKFDGVVLNRPSTPSSNLSPETFFRNNDAMGYLTVGLTYNLGKKVQEKSRYWANPIVAGFSDQEKEEMKKMINDAKKEMADKIADLENRIKADSDNDGVSDMFDKEADTKWDLSSVKAVDGGWTPDEVKMLQERASKNERIIVDGAGVALDIDHDGVPDHLDKCPFVAGSAQYAGCPLKPNAETIKILTDLQDVEFELDKDDFVDCSKKKSKKIQDACSKKQNSEIANMKRLVEIMNTPEYASAKLKITGHCDDRGTIEYNQDLSERRCKKIKERLVGFGLNANRIMTVGMGKTQPLVGPSGKNGTFTEFERDRNRRTEFTFE